MCRKRLPGEIIPMKNEVVTISLSILFNGTKIAVIERYYSFNPSFIKRTYLRLSKSSYKRLAKFLTGKSIRIWNVIYLNESITIDYLLFRGDKIQ